MSEEYTVCRRGYSELFCSSPLLSFFTGNDLVMGTIANSGTCGDVRLKTLVDRLTKEDVNADHHRRTVHRTAFVRPVSVNISGGDGRTLLAFSKNISPLGVGLVLENALPEGTIAKLSIHSLKGRQAHIRSELRWCEPFGNGWSLTGWKFIAEINR